MKLCTKSLPESEFYTDKFGVKTLWSEIMDDNTVARLSRLRESYERKMRRAKLLGEKAYWLRKMLRIQAYAYKTYEAVV